MTLLFLDSVVDANAINRLQLRQDLPHPTQQVFDGESAMFKQQGLCRLFDTNMEKRKSSMSLCDNVCGGDLFSREAKVQGTVSVTCINIDAGGGLAQDNRPHPDPDGDEYRMGYCKCSFPVMEYLADEFVGVVLPAIAATACAVLYGAMKTIVETVVEVGVEFIPVVGPEASMALRVGVSAAKTLAENGGTALSFLDYYQNPCGPQAQEAMDIINNAFNPMSLAMDAAGLAEAIPCPGGKICGKKGGKGGKGDKSDPDPPPKTPSVPDPAPGTGPAPGSAPASDSVPAPGSGARPNPGDAPGLVTVAPGPATAQAPAPSPPNASPPPSPPNPSPPNPSPPNPSPPSPPPLIGLFSQLVGAATPSQTPASPDPTSSTETPSQTDSSTNTDSTDSNPQASETETSPSAPKETELTETEPEVPASTREPDSEAQTAEEATATEEPAATTAEPTETAEPTKSTKTKKPTKSVKSTTAESAETTEEALTEEPTETVEEPTKSTKTGKPTKSAMSTTKEAQSEEPTEEPLIGKGRGERMLG
jgi:hypothetical protein